MWDKSWGSEDSPHPRLYLLYGAKEAKLIFGAIMKSKVRNTSVQVKHPPPTVNMLPACGLSLSSLCYKYDSGCIDAVSRQDYAIQQNQCVIACCSTATCAMCMAFISAVHQRSDNTNTPSYPHDALLTIRSTASLQYKSFCLDHTFQCHWQVYSSSFR